MTEKTTSKIEETVSKEAFKKLSIQVGLNGLSFCVFDTILNKVVESDQRSFKVESTPYLVLKELKSLFEEYNIPGQKFLEVSVIHRNNLSALVPKGLFDKNELPNYLKLNTKLLANDHIAFDEVKNFDIINVYVPFTNVNNYIFSLFGEFEFQHSGTVVLQALMGESKPSSAKTCYAYVSQKDMEVVVLGQRQLLLYNYFPYKTKEDFLYYILFVYEQLDLDTTLVQLKLFGAIKEDNECYGIAQEYIENVSVFTPTNIGFADEKTIDNIDLTILGVQ